MTIKNRMTTTAGALMLALVLAACGASDDGTTPAAQETPSQTATEPSDVEAEFNDADVQFAQGMIVHHQGAIEMSDLAATQAESEEVRTLAQDISAAQGPEIEQMSSWLEAWGEDNPAGADMEGMDMGGMDMGGMDMGAAMEELDGLSGAEFDRRFLEMMVEHHRGAVEMAQTELDEGANPEALDLAEKVVADQTAEIAEMEQMLEAL